jgi:glycosyltransferase involved in cell wall biosynthesis
MLKVSVIMPAFNAMHTIKESINSVLAQNYTEWELIIVNDGSSDDTHKIITSFLTDKRIIYVNLPKNRGLSSARNEGIRTSSGDYICFLDSDDIWDSSKLKKQIEFHNSNPEIVISHTKFFLFTNINSPIKPWNFLTDILFKKQGDMLPQLYYKNIIGILTVMIRRDVILEMGGFDTSMWTFEDQDLWLRLAKKDYQFGYVDKVLAYYRISPNGMVHKIGKYKKAYKNFLYKYHTDLISLKLFDTANGHFYRYFGTFYYKKGNFMLARLYFIKAIKSLNFSFFKISTVVYFLLSFAKYRISKK